MLVVVVVWLLTCFALIVSANKHVYQAFDANAPPPPPPPPVRSKATVTISTQCIAAVQAARAYGVHVHDLDGDNLITIDDVGPAAILFGLHWLDVAPRDGELSLKELRDAWSHKAGWVLKAASWALTFVSEIKYVPEQVFADCASHSHPTRITMADYMRRRTTTCMETCGKAEDVFNFIGSRFGSIE